MGREDFNAHEDTTNAQFLVISTLVGVERSFRRRFTESRTLRRAYFWKHSPLGGTRGSRPA